MSLVPLAGAEPAAPADVDAGAARPNLAARPLIGLVRIYQAARRGRPSPCRYVPSCSAYAVEALATHGVARGLWLTARRLGRCQPWGGYGADPVPPPLTRRRHGRDPGAAHVAGEAPLPTPTEES